jgi:hypothetical protein
METADHGNRKQAAPIGRPSAACPKMLKTFTNLPILTFILGSMRNRCQDDQDDCFVDMYPRPI